MHIYFRLNCTMPFHSKGTLLIFPGPLTHNFKLIPLESGEQVQLYSNIYAGGQNCYEELGKYKCIGWN